MCLGLALTGVAATVEGLPVQAMNVTVAIDNVDAKASVGATPDAGRHVGKDNDAGRVAVWPKGQPTGMRTGSDIPSVVRAAVGIRLHC